ncbi:hypothetical protein B296_00033731, partial [Ensete ventricosum]
MEVEPSPSMRKEGHGGSDPNGSNGALYIFREFPTERWRSSSFVFSISAFPSSFVASPDVSPCVPPPVYRCSREPPWSTLGFSSSSEGTPQDPKRESSQVSASRTNIMVDSRVLAEQRGNPANPKRGSSQESPSRISCAAAGSRDRIQGLGQLHCRPEFEAIHDPSSK